MSAAEKPRNMIGETERLLPALRLLVAKPEMQLSVICGKNQVAPADVWAWLQQFNGGKKDLSQTRLDSVLAMPGARDGAPAAAAEEAPVYGEGAKPGRAPRKPREDSARNVGEPWLKRGKRPRKDAAANYRKRLEGMAAGEERGVTEVAFGAFLRKWLGGLDPAAATVKAFLAWLDQEEPAPEKPKKERKVRAPKPEKKTRQPRAKKAKRKYTRRLASESEVAMMEKPKSATPATVALDLTFASLRQANAQRSVEWNGKAGNREDLGFAALELAGETGELCNIVKKMERARFGRVGGAINDQALIEEIADVVICADRVAEALGINLGAAVIEKFNKTSVKYGLGTRFQGGAS